MNHFPGTPLCPVCAGSDFKKSRRYPNMRYCKKHGIGLQPYDFSQFEKLFSSVSRIRLVVELCRISNVRLVYDDIDLFSTMTGVVDAYDALRGEDLAEQEYLKKTGGRYGIKDRP